MEWLRKDLVSQFFMWRLAVESLFASSHVVDLIRRKYVTVDHEADLGRQTEEVEGLFMAVAEFILLTERD
jgi:hypothetical protein